MKYLVSGILFFGALCSHADEDCTSVVAKGRDMGRVVVAEEGYNGNRMRIETDKAIIYVVGVHTIHVGERVKACRSCHADKHTYLCGVKGHTQCWQILE